MSKYPRSHFRQRPAINRRQYCSFVFSHIHHLHINMGYIRHVFRRSTSALPKHLIPKNCDTCFTERHHIPLSCFFRSFDLHSPHGSGGDIFGTFLKELRTTKLKTALSTLKEREPFGSCCKSASHSRALSSAWLSHWQISRSFSLAMYDGGMGVLSVAFVIGFLLFLLSH